MLLALLIIAAVLAVPAAIDVVRRPDFRRMGLRNALRRPTETALIVIGSALGTAIIAAALLVGDTFDSSIRDIARTDLGETDVILFVDDTDATAAAIDAITDADLPDVDGVIGVATIEVSMAAGVAGDDQRPVEPTVAVAFTDLDAAASFGTDPDRYGLRPTTDADVGEVLLNRSTAADLAAETDDIVQVFLAGETIELRVAGTVPDDGLAGSADAWLDARALGAFSGLDDALSHRVLVSGTGTVFDSVPDGYGYGEDVAHVADAAGVDHDRFDVKRELLDDADAEGAELSTIFSVVGGFSVLAGVLLLINLFVMLAEERKPNLGVLRAIGWKRSSMRRAFRVEGLLYSVPAAFLGALLGLAVGWVIVQLTKGILTGANPDSDFVLRFAADPASLITAGVVGLIIAMAAIWFTSWRISRLNIISAIRELPEPKTSKSRWLTLGGGGVAIVVGALLLITGLGADNAYTTVVGPPVIAVGLVTLARSVLPDRLVVAVGALAVLTWGASFFLVMPSSMTNEIDVEFFLLFGVVVVAGGVALATVSGSLIQRLIARRESAGVGGRMAMAYPTARPFRTASSLAMYSLIIFSLAFMAVMSSGFDSRSGDVIESTRAGHDVMVESNRSNPLTVDDVVRVDGVDSAQLMQRSGVEFWAPFHPGSQDDPEFWTATTVDPEFASVGSPTLRDRADRFPSDQAALAAVATDPTLVLVPRWFLGDEDGIDPAVGDEIVAMSDDGERRFEIAGITDNDYTWSGVWLARDAFDDLTSGSPGKRLYVATTPGADADAVADRIESTFLEQGADAETFSARVRRFIEADLGFFSLLRGYLLLGLVIGIGGLGVTLFRAVRERRRQIGMMRAMGLSGAGVRRWFLTEATFVSLMGIVTGMSLGLLTGYFVVSRSNAIDGDPLPFSVPWLTVAVITAIPLVASGLAALVPARRAAQLLPSEALRLAD